MKTRTVVLVALAVLLAGGGGYLLIRSNGAPDEGVSAKVTKAKAAKAVKVAAPNQNDGLMTGSIGELVFTDEIAQPKSVQQ